MGIFFRATIVHEQRQRECAMNIAFDAQIIQCFGPKTKRSMVQIHFNYKAGGVLTFQQLVHVMELAPSFMSCSSRLCQ